MIWLWNFISYSFLGFLLETAFAAVSGGRAGRKGLLVLPLCPVYGLGACLILLLPGWADARPGALFLLGGLTATAAEYLDALYHEKALGVAFWNYQGLPGNVQGRVCLPFSLAWGGTLPGAGLLGPPCPVPLAGPDPPAGGLDGPAHPGGGRRTHRRPAPAQRGHRLPALVQPPLCLTGLIK